MRGVRGWLLVYVIVSIPLMMFHSMGLSGWFLDYPFWLMVGIFLLLAIPVVLVPMKSPRAPRWNIALVWTMVVLMTLRAFNVILPLGSAGQPPLRAEELRVVALTLSGIVAFTLGWAIIWTKYFRESERVRNTFQDCR